MYDECVNALRFLNLYSPELSDAIGYVPAKHELITSYYVHATRQYMLQLLSTTQALGLLADR